VKRLWWTPRATQDAAGVTHASEQLAMMGFWPLFLVVGGFMGAVMGIVRLVRFFAKPSY